ncbi:radical SAM protein [archaeon]|jgi:hypothetical protein|nr:radical SAM protein [archaeon]MBT4373659.1 radical SAM protein [archaeon]MBT4531713.1 radical SAM protein [archaeon]MBT7001825.1 radical SAM protein [archaeon]MBT7281810.1 radical SAM protein [archaeon]
MVKRIDAIQRALKLRQTLLRGDKLLVADFSETLQGKDTSRVIDLMPDVETGNYVFRAKVNVKDIDPIAASKYGVDYFDVTKKDDSEIEDLIKRSEFDFPLWYKNDSGFEMRRVGDFNLPFILQVAGCNFHDGTKVGGCTYCFVDDVSNDGIPGEGKSFLSYKSAIESMLQAREKIHAAYQEHGLDLGIRTFRTSGGEPTIALDWILNAWREIDRRGLDFVGQLDSNLSTGPLVDQFENGGIYEQDILRKLGEYPIKVLTAFKGTDERNIQENVQAMTSLETQLYSLKKFIGAGFDIYPQLYNPNPMTLKSFLERVDSEVENLSLRIHIGPLKLYGPNSERLKCQADQLGVDPGKFIADKKSEWDSNYSHGCEIIDGYLNDTYGVGYRDLVRSDVPLKILKK